MVRAFFVSLLVVITSTQIPAEITPWFHVTGDMQVLQNSDADTDTSLVLGTRAVITL
jgi:hypothetical protein